jgi:hypothetical protein
MLEAGDLFVLTGHCPTLATFVPTSSLSLSSSSLRARENDEDVIGEAMVTAATPSITASIENEGRIFVMKAGIRGNDRGGKCRLKFWFDSD